MEKKIYINENERIDDLQYKGLKIIQNKNGFCFGIDSILLSDFAKEIKKGSSVIDLGMGTGIISILLSVKTKLSKITGVEIQKQVYEMAEKSIKLNNLENKINIINEDIKNIDKILKKQSYDVVVTNPPYKKMGTGVINKNIEKLISRHEIKADLEDFIKQSAYLLKDKGTIYMVHRPERLIDIIILLKKYNLEPKNIKCVHSNMNEKPNMLLIKAVKNAKSFLKFEKPLYIYTQTGEYTNDILKIYDKINN